MEKNLDTKNKWRKFYNKKLNTDYKNLFKKFDKLIFLKAPSFKEVINWRFKQEQNNFSNSRYSKKMKLSEISDFIQYYEKITKWMLKVLPKKADLVINIKRNQEIMSLIKK